VTGRDLVEDQINIAAGEPLDVRTRDIQPVGHAAEVRLYAEDAEAGFLPAVGRVEALRWPAGDGIRVDAGIALGSEVTGQFDPMLAKVIAWGPDRSTALGRLADALDETLVLGVVTNLRFLRWLVRQPVVLEGEARTDSLDRIWPPDDWAERTAIPDSVWTIAGRALIESPTGEAAEDPWTAGWRLNSAPSVRLEAESTARSVAISPGHAPTDPALVRVGDTVHLDLAGRSTAFRIAPPPDVDRAAQAAAALGGTASGPSIVVAPMPGAVLTVHVQPGQQVAIGDAIATLEAMKMEHAVTAPIAGRVTDIAVRAADQVVRGQVVATIEP
jgi:acetyl-CoA/propionyl-CoA carboxylase biotin carboxyl carrier protein